MKKIIIICLIFIMFTIESKTCRHKCNAQYTSKTVLNNGQVPFSSVSPELVVAFRNGTTYDCDYGKRGSFQGVLFGSRSMKKKELARYFFPDGNTSLLVAEDGPLDNFSKKKNLLAQNFNIFTKKANFSSSISLEPVQTIIGLGVHWRKCLLYNPLTGDGLWISLSTAIMRVRNDMNFQEFVLSTGGGPDFKADVSVIGNMKEAFNQPEWKFGKISTHSFKKSGLSDIEFKIGYSQSLPRQYPHLDLYGGFIVPTGNKNSGKHVFEPIVGRGKHGGIMVGGGFGKDIWFNYGRTDYVEWEVSLHSEYLFKNKQKRSFDLMHKPWSRYIELYINEDQAKQAAALAVSDLQRALNLATPGINVLTQSVFVTPGFAGDMNCAFVYYHKTFHMELGYNLFVRQAECVKLACPWSNSPAIKYAQGLGQTNPVREISGNKYFEQKINDDSGNVLIPVPLFQFEQSVITQEDIDLQSATTPELLAHTVYIALGQWFEENKRYPVMINGGLRCTFSQENAVVNKWLMWFKTGVSF